MGNPHYVSIRTRPTPRWPPFCTRIVNGFPTTLRRTLAGLATLGLLACWLGRFGPVVEAPLGARQAPPDRTAQIAEGEAAARVQCTTCHKFAPADVLPRSFWRDEVARMFLIKNLQPEPTGPPGTAARMVLLPPDWQAIVRYYEATAPDRLPAPAKWPAPDQKVVFRKRIVGPLEPGTAPAVSNIQLVDLDHDGRLEMVFTDMRSGAVYKAKPFDEQPTFVELARLSNPSHITPIDLDGDGVLDFLVGDLGKFLPTDQRHGAVVWLRGRKDGTFGPLSLEGWPRVSDVEGADFDGDGRLDLAVAAFGWRRSGDFTILKNNSTDYDQPSFVPFQIDKRTGSIHAVPVDINGDKRPDVITLFAQEHETVVAFVNQGGMRFDPQTIYEAPHPNWGSSGIQVVDLDKDGDLDVLMTHGDTFDDDILKAYHGIQWLENKGTYPFTEHTIATLAGVQRAQAVDLDGDGDLDIVACALVATHNTETPMMPAVVWLEQTKPGVFERHVIEVGQPTHASLDVGDYDHDGDIDIVVGNFSMGGPVQGSVEIFENQRTRKSP